MTYKYNTVKNTATNKNINYTIDLSKYFSTSTSNYKKKDYTIDILDKIKSMFPWTKKENTDTVITIDTTPYDTSYTLLDITPEALNLEWNKAISRLYDYVYYTNNPSYDFMINDIPVKIHGNYIQIGSKLYPKYTKSSFFDKLPKSERIVIYNISMSINSLEISA